MNNNSIGNAYGVLVKDFLSLIEYICPSDDNLDCYSHRTYELLLRASTEFESCCKHGLKKLGYIRKKKGNLDITDYTKLEVSWEVEQKQIGLLFWQPKVKYILPFDKWSTSSPHLKWYQDYNNVKHNRETHFQSASFENLVFALASLFLALNAEFGSRFINLFDRTGIMSAKGTSEYDEHFYNNSIFSIRILKRKT